MAVLKNQVNSDNQTSRSKRLGPQSEMQVLSQLPHNIQLQQQLETCGRTIYANEKVRGAVRDHEQTIVAKPSPKHKAKVVVLGNSGVGKTSIIYRHKYGTNFAPVNATIGASFVSCDVETSKDEEIRLQVWDTAGQERFRCMVPMYMRNADAALIVYDVTDRDSFESVGRWVKELERSCGTDETAVFLIGNKTDLVDKRQVSEAEGRAKAVKINAKFFEVSSDSPILFSALLLDVADDIMRWRERSKSTLIEEAAALEKKKIIVFGDEKGTEEIEVVKKKCCSLL